MYCVAWGGRKRSWEAERGEAERGEAEGSIGTPGLWYDAVTLVNAREPLPLGANGSGKALASHVGSGIMVVGHYPW